MDAAPARSRPSFRSVTAYTAMSVAIAALVLAGRAEAAIALAVPAYSWLDAKLHQRVARVEESIGPANGRTLRELVQHSHTLLERIVSLEDYQHQRNHDVLGALSPPNARLSLQTTEVHDELHKVAAHTAELLERVKLLEDD